MRERLFSRKSVGTGVPSLAKNLSGGSQNGAGAVPEMCLDRVGTVPEPRWNHARTTNLLLEQGHVERTHHAVCSFAPLWSRVPAQEREARLVTQLVAALHADDPRKRPCVLHVFVSSALEPSPLRPEDPAALEGP